MSKLILKYLFTMIMAMFLSLVIVMATGSAIFPLSILSFASAYFLYRHDKKSILYFIVCTVIQGVALILFAPYISSGESNGLIIIKELLVYGLAVIGFFKAINDKECTRENLYFIMFCFIALVGIVRANSLNIAIVALRQIIVIFACFYMGIAIKGDKGSNGKGGIIEIVSDAIVYMSVVVIVIGFFLYFMTEEDWISLGYADYWGNRTSGNVVVSFANFYTWDFGFRFKRMVSTFVNPIALAHFIGMGFVIEFLLYQKRYLIKTILLLGLLMCVSKSSLVLILSVIIVKYYSRIKKKVIRVLFILACIGIGFGGLMYLSDYSGSLRQATSIGNHFSSFLYGIRNGSLLGQGLGTAGYNAKLAGLVDFDEGYSESFLALCIAQIGIIGVLFLYLFLVRIIRRIYDQYTIRRSDYDLIGLILILTIIIESFFSASAISMLGTGLYFVYLGLDIARIKTKAFKSI